MSKKKITIGEMRTVLAADFFNDLEKIIDLKQNEKDIYYVLHIARMIGNTIVKKNIIIPQGALDEMKLEQPHRFIGTICYKVDNSKGKADCMWVLPFDYPMEFVESALHAGSEFIADSAMPVKDFIGNA